MKCLWVALAAISGVSCGRSISDAEATGRDEPRSSSRVPTQEATIGSIQFLSKVEVRLVSQGACGTIESKGSGRGSQIYGFELEARNLSNEPVFINPFYIHFVDPQSNIYTTTLTGCPPLLAAKRLASREAVRGFVPFAIPVAVAQGSLTVELPALVNSTTALRPTVRFHIELK